MNALSKVTAENAVEGHEDGLAAEASRPELVRGLKGLSKADRDVVFLLVFGELWEGTLSRSRVIIDQGTGLPLAVQDFERTGGPETGYTVLLAATSTGSPPA